MKVKVLRTSNVETKQSQDGKARRSKAKTVFLGTLYGMGAKKLSDRMSLPLEEAQQIIDDFFKGFPGVDKFTKDSQEFLKQHGYVTDLFGRRRHLPDALLPEYTVKPDSDYKFNFDFNPLLYTEPRKDTTLDKKIKYFTDEVSNVKFYRDAKPIVEAAKKEHIDIINNNGFISRALRQCLNARIQGSAASMTKLAMIMIDNDKELNELGFKLVATIHDEVFGECPTETSERCGERLCEVMIEAANVKCSFTNWKVDPYIVKRWYADEVNSLISGEYKKLVKKENDDDVIDKEVDEKAVETLSNKYPMIQKKYIEMMCHNTYDANTYLDI